MAAKWNLYHVHISNMVEKQYFKSQSSEELVLTRKIVILEQSVV